jgi:mRNA interferase MazF
LKRGEIWWADLGPHRPQEQTGRRPVIIWQSDTLSRALQSVLVIPLTTNLARARLAGTAMIESRDGAPPEPSVALAFQMRAVPKTSLKERIRSLSEDEVKWTPISGPPGHLRFEAAPV